MGEQPVGGRVEHLVGEGAGGARGGVENGRGDPIADHGEMSGREDGVGRGFPAGGVAMASGRRRCRNGGTCVEEKQGLVGHGG